MLSAESLQIVAYWPGFNADADTGETICRGCGEWRGLPTSDAVSRYTMEEALVDRAAEIEADDPDGPYTAIYCEQCGALIVGEEPEDLAVAS